MYNKIDQLNENNQVVEDKNDDIKNEMEDEMQIKDADIRQQTDALEKITQEKVNLELEIREKKRYYSEMAEFHADDMEKLNLDYDKKIREKTLELMEVTEKFDAIEEF